MTSRIDGVWEFPQESEPLVDWLEGRLQGLYPHVESVQRTGPNTISIASKVRPAWTIVIAIILFPIGLLALLAKDRVTARIHAEAAPTGGTRVRLDGAVADAAARRLNECYQQLQQAAAA
jgi:hypothetical protein